MYRQAMFLRSAAAARAFSSTTLRVRPPGQTSKVAAVARNDTIQFALSSQPQPLAAPAVKQKQQRLFSLGRSATTSNNPYDNTCSSRRRSFTTSAAASSSSSSSDDTTSSIGEQVYQEYVNLHTELQALRDAREREKSQAMYEAWQRTEEKQKQAEESTYNKKNQGVAVVKTLVKQTRKEMKQKQQPEQELQQRAQEKLQQAALEYGHAKALVHLGNQSLQEASTAVTAALSSSSDKDDGAKDKNNSMDRANQLVEKALECYKRAGEQGSKEGWFNLGHLLWTGFPDQSEQQHAADDNDDTDIVVILPPNQQTAMEAFEKAIQLGDTDAMYFCGVHLLGLLDEEEEQIVINGKNGGVDPRATEITKGLRLIQEAASSKEEPHGGALYYLALLHLNGHGALGIPPCSPKEFCTRLDAAIAAGNEDALFLRGHSYYHGENGYPQDYVKALGDFLLAADADHADAAVSAGAMLHAGVANVIPRDQEKAFELYQHAGELGSLDGWRNVAACYFTGQGVAQSLEMAKHITKTMKLDEHVDS